MASDLPIGGFIQTASSSKCQATDNRANTPKVILAAPRDNSIEDKLVVPY